MGNGYFLKAAENTMKAIRHVSYCDDVYKDAIADSVDRSFYIDRGIYGSDSLNKFNFDYLKRHTNKTAPDIHFVPCDTVSEIFDPSLPNYKFTVLNFASYKHPGGMFLQGSSAQEECLCHESILYPVLRDFDKISKYYSQNKTSLNRSMYSDIAIFSPDIIFERAGYSRAFADVITCAAPNYTSGIKCGVTEEENNMFLERRIKFLFDSLGYVNTIIPKGEDTKNALILGAWGCGVFGQNPYKVAQFFRKYIELGYADEFNKVIFAILPGKNFDEFLRGYMER